MKTETEKRKLKKDNEINLAQESNKIEQKYKRIMDEHSQKSESVNFCYCAQLFFVFY
jgi:cupin superfamily acireductone dioxygenase involved in methionine salvage